MSMTCPICDGKKEVFAFVNRGEDVRTHTQGMITCFACRGTGLVDDEQPHRVAIGTAFRRTRSDRGESLYACAVRLGVTSSQLSAYECGHVVPDEALVKIIGRN